MTISSKHPLYMQKIDLWEQMRDCYQGQHKIKERGTKYLPPTAGMVADGLLAGAPSIHTKGGQAYLAYRCRAVYPDLVNDAIEALLGIMHQKPAKIEVPTRMEPMIEQLTLRKESAQMLLRRINEEQLKTGRLGLLLDMPENPEPDRLPYAAMYFAENIINWDQGRRDGIEVENLNLVVLDETEDERQEDFTWENIEKYRVLVLGDTEMNEPGGQGVYRVGVFREREDFSESEMVVPNINGQTLNLIPFTFINTKDIVPDPDQPPLLGLADLSLTIYRGEADYRQSLFMQGQDTLVLIGSQEEDIRVGANATIHLPTGQGNDAKFIGPDSAGIPEQRMALENDYSRAAAKGSELINNMSSDAESGEALKIRVSARTSTLNQIALTGAFGLQNCLRQAATWLGEDPMQVIVEPNLDFTDIELKGDELVKLMTAKSLGAPLSLQSIHRKMQDRNLTEMPFEDEIDLIEEESVADLTGTSNEEALEDDEDTDRDA